MFSLICVCMFYCQAYLAIEAMADGGVRMGLPRDVAQRLASQTLLVSIT